MDEATAIIVKQLQDDVREVREASDEVRKSVAKLWTELRELSATVQGADGGNGIRSDVRELEKWRAKVEQHLNSLDSRLQHYMDVEREETCHGIAALQEHLDRLNDEEGEKMKIKEANISAKALILSTSIPAVLSMVVGVISLLVAAGVIG